VKTLKFQKTTIMVSHIFLGKAYQSYKCFPHIGKTGPPPPMYSKWRVDEPCRGVDK